MGGLGSAQLSFSVALPWRHDPPRHSKLPLQIQCALTKQGQRFLTKLAANAGNPSVANKLISKFLSTSPKSTALTTLSYLLSPHTAHPHLSSLALSMYSKITEASWFEWNPKLVAALVALLDKQGEQSQSEALISETISKLGNKERELAQFHCQLVESHSKMSSKCGFDRACTYLHQLLQNSSSVYVKRRAFESMVGGLCAMDRPGEADELIEEMRVEGLKASVFEFRSVVYGYGRLGMFEEMLKVVDQMDQMDQMVYGYGRLGLVMILYAVRWFLLIEPNSRGAQPFQLLQCGTKVPQVPTLTSYGAHNELAAMANWLQNMKDSSVPFSIRTYNSVLNSCPTIMAMLQEPKAVPCSVGELSGVLDGDEALVVKELVGSAVVDEAMVWDSAEAKLDLHGMHLGSADLVMLEWFEAMVPAEVIVCGLGKHSSVRGESPVKDLVEEMMHQMESPMRIDRKNVGCFIAKGRAVKDWLCKTVG